ncbi:MAG: sugar phosphate isomerase/epimerase [Ruminococcaceae bacterium]|nr:sugar phosphate isomerase/epimerase [Oscillospiraceae bacterium]
MLCGIAMTLSHSSPEEWAKKHKEMGLSAVVFPLNYTAPTTQIDSYVKAAKEAELLIAEVGSWCNPLDSDIKKRTNNLDLCIKQLELAEYIGASCCVNITGTDGEIWDGSYASNYSEKLYTEAVLSIQKIIDSVNPKLTRYTIEPMPHMIPDSPETYLKLLKDVNRNGFGVHLDVVNMITSPRVYFNNKELTERCFRLLGDYICSCHVKDSLLEHSLTVSIKEVPCGKGGFDIKYYLDKINEKNLPAIIEHLSEEQAYRNALAYINTLYRENL